MVNGLRLLWNGCCCGGWPKTLSGRLVDRIETLRVRFDGSMAGSRECSAKFSVARPRFVVPTRRSVTVTPFDTFKAMS